MFAKDSLIRIRTYKNTDPYGNTDPYIYLRDVLNVSMPLVSGRRGVAATKNLRHQTSQHPPPGPIHIRIRIYCPYIRSVSAIFSYGSVSFPSCRPWCSSPFLYQGRPSTSTSPRYTYIYGPVYGPALSFTGGCYRPPNPIHHTDPYVRIRRYTDPYDVSCVCVW